MKEKGYICPLCNIKFPTEEEIKKHSIACWREKVTYHKTKHAPQSQTITTRQVNDDILNFFNSFNEVHSNGS